MAAVRSILTFILSVTFCYVSAQPNSKSKDKYSYAKHFYTLGDTKSAVTALEKLISEDSTYVDPYLLLGEIYHKYEQYSLLSVVYEKLAKRCGKKYPDSYMLFANVLYHNGNYPEAAKNYNIFINVRGISADKLAYAQKMLLQIEFALEIISKPVPFSPVNLGDSVNSFCDEYYPYLSPDENLLIITRKVPLYNGADPASDNTQEDFYYCEYSGAAWSKARPLKGTVNTRQNEGAQTVTGEGNYMVFAACNREGGYGSCDLYFSKKINGKWTSATNMGYIVNSAFWESQPAISADGTELYFASERPGCYGSSDIWKTTRNQYGKWTKPVPLDTTINTEMSEISPFIHPDGKTLFFCSNGHKGVGGYDIFRSERDSTGKWCTPKNLGYPINTSKNEIGLIVNAKGDKAFITSSRDDGYGLYDIYMFELYSEARPGEITYIKGIVTDSQTGKTINAVYELTDIETGKTIVKSTTDDETGSFLVCISPGNEYGLFVSADNYLCYSENFNLKNITTEISPFIKKIPLSRITPGLTVVLKNVYFDTDSFELKKTSEPELKKVIEFLQKNSSVKIELGGHTDNTGNPDYNKSLSLKRARSVYNFLVLNGIKASRLEYRGYGDTKPFTSNENAKGRELNRRTEMKIISN